ncbi:MAG TPA: hypothetical protein VG942_06690 [Hyphomonadaceae bacterium]|nr:hypothetical protein [Hyphomonadaceae bacterium]
MLRKSLLLAAAVMLASAPAFAQSHRGGDRGGDHNRGGGNAPAASHAPSGGNGGGGRNWSGANNGGGNRFNPPNNGGNRSSGQAWNNNGGSRGDGKRPSGNRNTYPPLFAGQRNDHRGDDHRGGDRNDHRGDRDRDHRTVNNYYYDRDHYRSRSNVSLGFLFGSPGYYDPFYYDYPVYSSYGYNDWGLAPYECRYFTEFGYWYGRPADIEIRRCADAWGSVYVVDSARRLYRYR